MSKRSSQSGPPHSTVPAPVHADHAAPIEELDPANQSLAEALRKSFGVLKLLMLVLVVLYFLSGWFSVKPNEVGLVLRFGRVVSDVLPPGWHWSLPYPFERYETVPTSERQIPVEFMFELTEDEKTGGIKGGPRFDVLSPYRDDFLITGDVNILHVSLLVKYQVRPQDPEDVIAYLRHVYPQPAPQAGINAPEYRHYPEYTLMSNLVRDAVIATAARREALQIRGEGQNEFLAAVAGQVNEKLRELKERGVPLGLSIDPESGIIAPKKSDIEAIMPPRQTQEVFDQVLSAFNQKSVAITKAHSEEQALLLNTAGPRHQEMAKAIDDEYAALRALSAAESAGRSHAEIEPLQAALAERRRATENLLTEVASGNVRAMLRQAEIARDAILKEASGDFEQFIAVLPEYLRNPDIFMSRLLDETYAKALASDKVIKVYIPPNCLEWRLQIPRGGSPLPADDKSKTKDSPSGNSLTARPELRMP